MNHAMRYEVYTVLREAADKYGMSSHIKDLILDYGVIAGGAISSRTRNEEPRDYDIYFKSSWARDEVYRWCRDNPAVERVPNPYGTHSKSSWDKPECAFELGKLQLIMFTLSDSISHFDYMHAIPSVHLSGGEWFKPMTLWRFLAAKNKLLVPNPASDISLDKMKGSSHTHKLRANGWHHLGDQQLIHWWSDKTRSYHTYQSPKLHIPEWLATTTNDREQLQNMRRLIDTLPTERTGGEDYPQMEVMIRMLGALESNPYADLELSVSDYILSKLGV